MVFRGLLALQNRRISGEGTASCRRSGPRAQPRALVEIAQTSYDAAATLALDGFGGEVIEQGSIDRQRDGGVGTEPQSGAQRFTLGQIFSWDGIAVISMALEHLDLVWVLIWTLVIANVLAALMFLAIGRWLALVPFMLVVT